MELLANILRPQKLDDVIGQKHLIGKDKILSNFSSLKTRREYPRTHTVDLTSSMPGGMTCLSS